MAGKASEGLRLAFFVASLGTGVAVAQQDGPAGVVTEAGVVYPGLDLAMGYDDNLFSSSDDNNKVDSYFLIFSPWVRVEVQPRPHRFDLTLRLDAGRYSSSPADDYDDYQAVANVHGVFSARADVKLRAEHLHGHDPRGSTDRPLSDEPDQYNNTGAEAIFGYGAPGARGRVELNGGFFSREYTNNRAFTEASDRDTGIFGATFLWRVAPRTQLLFQGDRRSIDYQLPASTLDSDETRLYVGARWEATAATSGTVKFGRLDKEFESEPRQDVRTSSWDVGVRWSPLTYSVFDLNTSRQTNESTGIGDTIVTNDYRLVWTHAWSSRVRSQLLAGWRKDDFRGEGVTREDDTGTFGLRMLYQFRRWLRLGAEYTHTDRDSNNPAFKYDRNLILFTLNATL